VISRFALFFLILSLLVSCAKILEEFEGDPVPNIQSPPGTTTTIVLLRHGGRDPDLDGLDPPLTRRGVKRAEELPSAIGDIGVTVIYCPDLKRNIATAQPLADHLGLKITIVPNTRLFSPKKVAKGLLDRFLTKHTGGVVVWVGNIGNLNEMYEMLDGTGEPPSTYGLICIMTIPDIGPTRIKKLTYGDDVGQY
jgi:phosphohistidine phosphatase SixA